MKIFDCFIFFNEMDLLELRLKLLDPFVDHFVLTESNVTYSGRNKPYYFEQNRDRYAPWLHKIIYIQAKQDTEGMDFEKDEKSYTPGSDAWKLENGLRNFLAGAKTQISGDDRVIISDLDEIPNPYIVQEISGLPEPRSLSLLFHYYFLNCQNIGYERWWKGSVICTGKQFNDASPQHFRDNRHVYRSISEAGWHFSFLGGLEKIKYKIQSFAHLEFAREEFWNDENILRSMEKGEDLFRRPGVKYAFFPLSYYPPFLRKQMRDYPALLHLKKTNPFTDFYYLLRRLFKGQYST